MSGYVKSHGLSEIIASEIDAGGPMSFARYMELALYHPGLGYYASGRAGVGRQGDFYTNVSVGAIFGKILCDQFEEIWRRLGCPLEFPLVEQGAHDGQLAFDVLSQAEAEFRDAVRYWIVEPSSALAQRQREKLGTFEEKVRWFSGVAELPEFAGVHFSNELIDAMPFHLLVSSGGEWRELCVAREGAEFVFVPQVNDSLIAREGLPARPDGYITECRPVARQWLRDLTARMKGGVILVIDYGFSRSQLLAPHRTEGTFSCYQTHRRDAKPLESPGEKDITAHVDFSALAVMARERGWAIEGFTDQHHFLVGAAEGWLRELGAKPLDAATQKVLRGVQTLLHPESMGTQFRYFGISLGLDNGGPLAGFRYARDTEAELLR